MHDCSRNSENEEGMNIERDTIAYLQWELFAIYCMFRAQAVIGTSMKVEACEFIFPIKSTTTKLRIGSTSRNSD